MAINWTLYQKRLQMNGTTIKDRQVNYMKNAITNNFKNTPSYRSAYFNSSITPTDILAIDTDKYNIKLIQMKPDGVLNVGDIIVFDSRTWLCTQVDKTNPVYQFGKVNLCTQTITLYKNNTSYQIPCVIESGVRTTQLGTDETTYIEMPSTTIVMRLPNTSITRLINRGEIYQLGIQNWSIVDINDIIEPGLLIFKMEYSQEVQESHVYSVEILNGSAINVQQGKTLQLNVDVKDNGILLSPIPTITYTSSDQTKCTVSTSGLVSAVALGSCVIGISANGVSDSIEVTVVENTEHNYTYSLLSTSTPDTEIKVNQTKNYVVQKYDNGVSVTQTFTFSVSGDSSAYILTVIDGNRCEVKALKSGISIVLSAVDNSDNSKIVNKTIVLKNIF